MSTKTGKNLITFTGKFSLTILSPILGNPLYPSELSRIVLVRQSEIQLTVRYNRDTGLLVLSIPRKLLVSTDLHSLFVMLQIVDLIMLFFVSFHPDLVVTVNRKLSKLNLDFRHLVCDWHE